MDTERFQKAYDAVIGNGLRDEGIGTLGEKSIHAVLKSYFEPYADSHEQAIGSLYADIVGENGIIEIQTRQWFRLNKKLEQFLPLSKTTLVYPLILRKRINWVNPENGEMEKQGKFLRRDSFYKVFSELSGIRQYLCHPNLTVTVVGLQVEEYRLLNGYGEKKQIRAKKVDKIPTELLAEWSLHSKADYAAWIPAGLPEPFSSAEFAKCAKISRALAQSTLLVLTEVGAVQRIGKEGRSILYCPSAK